MARICIALAILCMTASPAGARVPSGWLGVVADGPVLEDPQRLDREVGVMKASGAGAVRTAFYWRSVQPSPEVLDWSSTDAVVRATAARGLPLLPTLHVAPDWAAVRPLDFASPPDPAAFGAFATEAVRRYGPAGSFWAENPTLRRVPIREWQIWNEPNVEAFWSPQPFARDFVATLRAAAAGVRGADPGAKVVLAGLVEDSWRALASLYRAGARGSFDSVAVHPFTRYAGGVVEILERVRAAMKKGGDPRMPLQVTELTWPSSLGKKGVRRSDFDTDESGQARLLSEGLDLLARERRRLRIERVYWFTWLRTERDTDYAFDFSGLRRLEKSGRIVAKPAFLEFRRSAARLRR